MKKIGLLVFVLCMATFASAQKVNFTFDDNVHTWNIKKGKAEVVKQGGHVGQAMKLSPNTSVAFSLDLQPASSHRITAWMRTESGADDFTMVVKDLDKNNISATTALAAWAKIEKVFNVSDGQKTGTLEFVFGNSQGNTFA